MIIPTRRLAAVAAGSLGLLLIAPITGASAAAPAADSSFAKGNEQVNLAEITIGNIALQRASSQSVRDLATKTIADHQAAQAKLKAVAAKEGVTLPTAPNAQQQAQAATLKSVPATEFDLQYVQIQVAGHQMSIAATNTEIASGKDAAIVSYAKDYLPVATMHLTMSQQDLATLGGTPTAAPAGNGGQAAASNGGPDWQPAALGGLGLILLAGAGVAFASNRKADR